MNALSLISTGVLALGLVLAGCTREPEARPPVPPPLKKGNGKTIDPPSKGGSASPFRAPQPVEVAAYPESPTNRRVVFDGEIVAHFGGEHDRVEATCHVISGQGRPLEYLVVTEAGNHHEALLMLRGSAGDLKQAMELIGLREGHKKLARRGDPTTPEGQKLSVTVRWMRQGKLVEQPVEDWVWYQAKSEPMARGGWVFTGSISQFRDDLNTDVLQADASGNVIGVWRDPACVINSTLPEAVDDMNWFMNQAATIPRPMEPVTLVIRRG